MTVFVTIPYASFFEWLLHKYVMHRPIFGFLYAYRAHAQVHHGIFRADHSYHLHKEEDKWTIPMAWWNSVVLVPLASSPFIIIGWALESLAIPITAFVVIYMYYGVYEVLHWCMHLPKKRRVEFWRIFQWLNGHHVLHHRYTGRNFNVVFPLADWCLGTLLLLAPQPFNQVRGIGVPSVQPKPAKN